MTSKVVTSPQKITQIQCEECNHTLRQQYVFWLTDSFKYLPQFLSAFYLEIEALLAFAEYRFSISINKPQPGDFLQNIEFKPLPIKTKLLWLLLSVIFPYLKKRLAFYAESKDGQVWKAVSGFIGVVDKICKIFEFINYAIFIFKGQYRNMTQRILKIDMKFINQQNKRILNFSLMNRMLIWQIYELFLKTILPSLFAVAGSSLKNVFFLSSFMRIDDSGDTKKCMYCGDVQVIMPVKVKACSHQACYYCYKTSQNTSKCKICQQQIDVWIPLR